MATHPRQRTGEYYGSAPRVLRGAGDGTFAPTVNVTGIDEPRSIAIIDLDGGHSINIEALGLGNTIYASDLLEAESLSVELLSSGRFRAKRIHASSCNINIENDPTEQNVVLGSSRDLAGLFDTDDGGATCDISSLYVTEEALVTSKTLHATHQAVRIKSNHGHVTIEASAPIPDAKDNKTGLLVPVVDLGSVNGSCEVYIDVDVPYSEAVVRDSCRVHFDSVSPDSVSVLRASNGNIDITMDRKVETDLRMLSSTQPSSVDIDTLLLDEDDPSFGDLHSMLEGVAKSPSCLPKEFIQVKTKAFASKANILSELSERMAFLDGWVENKSEEPDSRFDRKLRGETGSVGKIRLEGASAQALHHFHVTGDGGGASTFARPIVAAVGSGKILLETLSWLGNIARRYGMSDRRNTEDLGRTATRRGRSFSARDGR